MTPEQAGHEAAEALKRANPEMMEGAFEGLAERMKRQHRRDMIAVAGCVLLIIASIVYGFADLQQDIRETTEKNQQAIRDGALKNCQDQNAIRASFRASITRELARSRGIHAQDFGIPKEQFQQLLKQANRDRREDRGDLPNIDCEIRFDE